jgi:hypothetical protein
VRARYGELVASLVDDGSVASIPGRTSGEYLTDVARTLPTALDAFTAATLVFEAAWYGGRESSVDELAQLRSLAAEVRKAPRAPVDAAEVVS